jgi:glycosyltransferase involved in cell wall biosynthesis
VRAPRLVHVASGREWRGGQRQVLLLARALGRTGEFDQLLVTDCASELARRATAAGIAVRGPRWRAALDPRALWATWRAAAAGGRNVILHAHDPHALVLAGLVAARTGARLVVTRRVVFHLRRGGFWRRADRVVAISEAVRRVLVSDGIDEERISLVPSGVDLEELRAAAPRGIRAALGLSAETPIAVSVGALTREKDHATLLRAAATARTCAPSLRWVVVGDGPERGALARLIEGSGLQDRVHLLGFDQDPPAIIREATLLVHSASEEGLGTTVLDAMALAVPVVATAAGGIPELLADGAGVLVPVGDAAALAEATVRIVTDPALRSSCVARATLVVARYSDVRMAEGMRSVYRSVLSSP